MRRERQRLVVLESVALGGSERSFADHLATGLSAFNDIEVVDFTYRRALLGRWNVLHVHWPEFLIRSERGAVDRAKRRSLFFAVLVRTLLPGHAVVRTLHNLTPHDNPRRIERFLLWCLDRRTSRYIRLNPTTPPRSNKEILTALHPHYRETTDPLLSGASAGPRSALFFGFLRPYKGIEEMIEAFSATESPSNRLVIAGKAADSEIARVVEEAGRKDPRISVMTRFLTDQELVRQVELASLVVLPYPALHNSGVLLYALSVGRPVLVIKNEITDNLQGEVGVEWVRQFTGKLAAKDIDAALEKAGDVRGHRPALVGREWTDAARTYHDAYISLSS